MSIKIVPEPDIYISQENLERAKEDYNKCMGMYCGTLSFESFLKRWLKRRSNPND